jgi:hypothetical protein
MPMNVKAAVDHAKNQIQTLFGDEGIRNLGLEEVIHDDTNGVWRVTIGFSRPWDEPRNALAAIAGQNMYWRRAYKVVTIDENSSDILSIKSLEDKPE